MSFVVFGVEDAGRLTLMCPPIVNGMPTLKPILLSFIETPLQATRSESGDFGHDEPCAADAAELIRAAFIGKQVKFKEDYFDESLNRSAGRLQLLDGSDASVMLLKAGLATISEDIPPRMGKALFDQYTHLMDAARKSGKGVFHPDAKLRVRHMNNLPSSTLASMAKELGGKEMSVRIERVMSGVFLIISAKEFGETEVIVRLTGVADDAVAGSELPQHSKFHTARFLLNRKVNMRIDGIDTEGGICISIVSPKGSFQEELLSKGLVRIDEATLAMSSQQTKMCNAEKNAKAQKVGIWKNSKDENKKIVVTSATTANVGTQEAAAAGLGAGTSSSEVPVFAPDNAQGFSYKGPRDFTGVLVQVVHGDTVVVQDDATKQNIRLSLAGVRTSKNITRDQDGNAPECRVTYSDFAWEAKEFLRSRFIGSRVAVHVEYARVMQGTSEVRPAASVTIEGTEDNIGALLLGEGYANFFLGKTDICSAADVLQAFEEAARAKKKGLHSGKSELPVKVVELGRLGESRGRYYLSFLQRGMQGNRPPVLKGIMDLVLGPTSFRVYIPKEHFQIPVKLAGVIAPSTALNPNEKSDPFANEAKDFVVRLAQQREVNVQVYASDRGGNFISSVALPDGTNLSTALVAEGLATLGNADRLPFMQQLLDDEAAARAAKKNIWSIPGSIPQRAAKLDAERAATCPHQMVRVLDDSANFGSYTLTEVGDDGISVYLQEIGSGVSEKKGKMQALINRTVCNTEYVPKKGELVIAQYRADKTWCRGKVIYIRNGEGTLEVNFIDYGNTEIVRIKDIRAIPRGPEYAIVRDLPPFVIFARLAFLKKQLSNDMYAAAADTVYEYTDGEVMARVLYKDSSGNSYYTVTVNENVVSLSETLLQRGLAILDKRAASVDSIQYKRHQAAQEIARKGHKGMWQYGDVDDDDDYL